MSRLTKPQEAYMYGVILLCTLMGVLFTWRTALICFLCIGLLGQVVKFIRHRGEE